MRRSIIIFSLGVVLLSIAGCTPQLGKSSDERVIAAMTPEEKVRLLVGTSTSWPMPPEPSPATIHRPPVPEGYWEQRAAEQQANSLRMQGRVPGCAGVSYAIPRLGIPSIVFVDGPVGVRIDNVATAFPSTALLASTRDTTLAFRMGQAIGEEMLAYGADILLAPGMNLMRNPLCGRNYEYLSSDVDITASMAAAYVKGLQSAGVGACVKHYAVNNQETFRNGIDVILSDELLRGKYLKAFERVVREAQPWCVMSSYNRVNGTFASENKYLLTDILRNEWGFGGFVMTDWWAEECPIRMQQAGCDMLMPGTQDQIDTLLAALHNGRLDEKVLDRNLKHVLAIIRRTPTFRGYQPDGKPDLAKHAALAREIAAKGMVLLENNGVLPVDSTKPLHIALTGTGSYNVYVGGSGSGNVTRPYKVSLADALPQYGYQLDKQMADRYRTHVAQSLAAQPAENFWTIPTVGEIMISTSEWQRMARENDLCILTLQRMAGEGADRALRQGDYYLTEQEKTLIANATTAFHKVGKKVIVLLNIGSSIELTDVHTLPDAILLTWLPGQEAGYAIADVLTGRVMPKGQLPMPFYMRYDDVPSAKNFPFTDNDPNRVEYKEEWEEPERVLYPVGYGLHYNYYPDQPAWLTKAEALKPELHHTMCKPQRMVVPVTDKQAFQDWRYETDCIVPEQVYRRPLKNGQVFTFDFGRHMVGYLTLNTRTLRRCQDAPLRLRLMMGELPAEMNTPLEPWGAWLSRGWMQDEIITVMQTDRPITLSRRMAGRYLKVEVLGTSQDFDCALSDVTFDAVSSAGEEQVRMPEGLAEELQTIYRVGVETLRECMLTVYEDGPKRDRRLWAGDMYLESLANRYSFRNFDLTKRCLYLFAGLAADDGTIVSNLFEYPAPHPQEGSYMLTYCLLWNSTLKEYFVDTRDMSTVQELWPVAKRQIEDALTYVDRDYLFDIGKRPVWLFFDWRDGLDVSELMQCATIFALDDTYLLAQMIGRESEVSHYPKIAQCMRQAARNNYFDAARGVMFSGADKQVSVLAQTWAVKAGVLAMEQGQTAIRNALNTRGVVMPGTPYATHYLIEAMLICGMNAEAKEYLTTYWGGMVNRGADTFWEAYDPQNDYLSPYDFFPVNSACHAWSCTPVYFMQKYPSVFRQMTK